MSSQAGAKVALVELPYNAISSATQVGVEAHDTQRPHPLPYTLHPTP
jgi:hypothetical protein